MLFLPHQEKMIHAEQMQTWCNGMLLLNSFRRWLFEEERGGLLLRDRNLTTRPKPNLCCTYVLTQPLASPLYSVLVSFFLSCIPQIGLIGRINLGSTERDIFPAHQLHPSTGFLHVGLAQRE